jgi:hypothetical protein
MKRFVHLFLLFYCYTLFGHENHHLYNITIDNIALDKDERRCLVSFDISTKNKKALEFAKVELTINNKPVAYKNIASITKNH